MPESIPPPRWLVALAAVAFLVVANLFLDDLFDDVDAWVRWTVAGVGAIVVALAIVSGRRRTRNAP